VFPSKRDFDNLAKAATDPLNGIAWIDDDQITTAHVVRRFSGVREDPGRTHITVTEDDYISTTD
jgi:Holliday junction resolvase RusA-like endonuclease